MTFTAPKVGQVLPPNCEHVGELLVCADRQPPGIYSKKTTAIFLSLVEPAHVPPLIHTAAPVGA